MNTLPIRLAWIASLGVALGVYWRFAAHGAGRRFRKSKVLLAVAGLGTLAACSLDANAAMLTCGNLGDDAVQCDVGDDTNDPYAFNLDAFGASCLVQGPLRSPNSSSKVENVVGPEVQCCRGMCPCIGIPEPGTFALLGLGLLGLGGVRRRAA